MSQYWICELVYWVDERPTSKKTVGMTLPTDVKVLVLTEHDSPVAVRTASLYQVLRCGPRFHPWCQINQNTPFMDVKYRKPVDVYVFTTHFVLYQIMQQRFVHNRAGIDTYTTVVWHPIVYNYRRSSRQLQGITKIGFKVALT